MPRLTWCVAAKTAVSVTPTSCKILSACAVCVNCPVAVAVPGICLSACADTDTCAERFVVINTARIALVETLDATVRLTVAFLILSADTDNDAWLERLAEASSVTST